MKIKPNAMLPSRFATKLAEGGELGSKSNFLQPVYMQRTGTLAIKLCLRKSGHAVLHCYLRLWLSAVVLLGAFITAPYTGSTATLHVWPDSPNPTTPFTDWDTAAHTIQEAVNAAQVGETVLVTNGVYETDGMAIYGTMTNRVAIDKAITVLSVNGPNETLIVGVAGSEGINGNGAIRCAYISANAVLSGFTLTNGHTQATGNYDNYQCGGGAWGEESGIVTNCILTGNSASHLGGGAYFGSLFNCILTNNLANWGGGAYGGTRSNCTLTSNSANYGGGASFGTFNNCNISGNKANYGGGRRIAR